MTAHDDEGLPTVAEIAALTSRLRRLSAAGRHADPAERAAFLADKDALIARIAVTDRATNRAPIAAPDAADATGDDLLDGLTADEVGAVARAAAGGYAMVGPSARTWAVDPATGVPSGPVSEAEHRLVRDLIARERLDGTEPVWLACTDGGDEIVARVVPFPQDVDEPLTQDHGAPTARPHRPEVVNEPSQGLAPNGPAGRDDPAALDARLAKLRDRLAASSGEPPGGWRTVSAAAAAQDLTDRGADPDRAHAAVADYLQETSERLGAHAYEWGLDQGDIDAIAPAHRLPAAATLAAEQDAAAAERADQLTRGHTDDQAATEATASAELEDGAGWWR